MSLSFDDEESLKEATESLCFSTFPSDPPGPSDPNTSSMPTQIDSQGQPQAEERSDSTWRYDIQSKSLYNTHVYCIQMILPN